MSTEVLNATVICTKSDLVPFSGVCALVEEQQIAIFYFPGEEVELYAISNWDPFGKANVLSRGITGDSQGRIFVASPLYKQHFDLNTGQCFEDESVSVPTFKISFDGNNVVIEA